MQKQIIQRIQELGGEVNSTHGETLQDHLQSISFPHPLYDKEWELYGIDKFVGQHQDLYKTAPSDFFELLLSHYFSDHELPYGQAFWRYRFFSPMTEGTADFKEWHPFDRHTNLSPIRSIVGEGPLEFIQLIYSYGYPDSYYICLQDPNPSNPMIFGTDHEEFFEAISNCGTLADFLMNFCTKEEFLEIVRQDLANNTDING